MNIMAPLALTHRAEPSMNTTLPPAGKAEPAFLCAGRFCQARPQPPASVKPPQFAASERTTQSAASIQPGLDATVFTGLAEGTPPAGPTSLFLQVVMPPWYSIDSR